MGKKEEKKRISIGAIDNVLGNAPGIFKLTDIAAQLNAPGDDELLKRLEKLIDGDVNYFHTDDWECELKIHYFCRMPFAVTPEKWEIEQGVLFPPSRLTPFLTEDVFPSDAELLYDDEPLPKREITLPFSEALHYSMLIGHEEILDYLEADSDANSSLRRHLAPTTLVTMTVFDCRELYRELDFKEGDALILQLTDPDTGEFEVNYRPRAERTQEARGKWIRDYEKAMVKVVKKFRDYLEIPHQIGWAFYYGGEELAGAGASVEEFMQESDLIEMRTDGDHSILGMAEEESCGERGTANDEMLPDGLSISSGETSDFGIMLRQIGSSLSAGEIDGFILDNCAARDMTFERFFARIFPHGEPDYADEAQEAIFLNALEERFEELSGNYNRLLDESTAPLRSTIMEMVEERMDYFAHQDEEVHDHDHCHCHEIEAVFAGLNTILAQLNTESYDPSEEELDQLRAKVEQYADRLESLLD